MADHDWLLVLLGIGAVAVVGWFALGRNVAAKATYQNEERWKVLRDAEGNLVDIVVHRDASET